MTHVSHALRRRNNISTVAAGDTVSNSTAENFFATNCVLKANTIQANASVKIEARGVISTTAVGLGLPLTFRLYANSTLLAPAAVLAITTLITSPSAFFVDFNAEVITGGSSSVVEAQGYGALNMGIIVLPIPLDNTATVNGIDWTVDQTLKMSVQWGVANLLNTITLRQFRVTTSA